MELEANIRSEEVQDLMEKMPRSFIKWGSSMLLLLILLLVALAAIIQYPDVINGSVVITTKTPPSHVAAKSSGIIREIFVENNAYVKADDPLLVINSMNYKTIFWVDSILDKPITNMRSMGSAIASDDYGYVFWRDQASKLDNFDAFINSFSGYIKALKDYYQLSKNKGTLKDALLQIDNKDLYSNSLAVIKSQQELKMSINSWKDANILKAPVSGTVSFSNYWAKDQELKNYQEFCVIIPENKDIICKVSIPIEGSSKVKPGQKVRIILSNFPENEFGFIEGSVVSISSLPVIAQSMTMPSSSSYTVIVSIKMPIISSLNKVIGYMPEMQGSAEIITDKKTILTRLTENFFRYVNKSQ